LGLRSAQAGPIYWNAVGTTWNNTADWVGGAVPTAAADVGFDSTQYGSNSSQPVTDAGGDSVLGIFFGNSGGTATTGTTLTGTGALNLGTDGITLYANTGATTISAPITLGGAQSWTNSSANLFTVNGNVTNAGYLLTVTGTGSTSIGGIISGTGGLTKSGTGTLTLSGADTYSGATAVTAGALTIANNSSLGTGTGNTTSGVTVSSGAALQLINGISTTTAVPLNLSGTGVTANPNGALENISGTNSYSGLITLGAAATIGSDAGTLNITNAGTIYGTSTGFGLTLAGAGNGSMTSIFNGGVNGTAGAGTLTKSGTGTWTLAGLNTYTGATTVSAGVLNVTGSINGGGIGGVGRWLVGNTGSSSAILKIAGGTIGATYGTAPSVGIGSAGGAIGSIQMSSGTLNSTSELWIGYGGANSFGALTMTGGTLSVGSWMVVDRGGNAVMNVSNATVNNTGANFTIGTITGGYNGLVNISGSAIVNIAGAVLLPEQQNNNFVVLNMSGSAALNIAGGAGLNFAGSAGYTGSTGILNLLGGTVKTPIVQHGSTSTGTFLLDFNGGTLKASAASATFFTGLTGAYVYGGNGTIDNGGNPITIGQSLLAPTGSGVGIGSVVPSGTTSGYIDTPIVTITGGGGVGATAVATINYSTGTVTGITMTNPGTGYTSAPTFALVGGGGAATIGGTATLVANTSNSGGLAFQGTGATTLSGTNTYTGGTSVSAGSLSFLTTLAKPSTGTVTVAAGATLGLGVSGTNAFTAADVGYLFAGTSAGDVTNVNMAATSSVGLDTTNGNYAYASNIGSSTYGLTKLGSGTLTLSGSNIYTGGTSIVAGTLAVTNDNNLGATSGGLAFGGGTLLNGNTNSSFTTARAITLGTGGGTLDTGLSGNTGNTSSFSGTLATGGNALTLQGYGLGTYSGAISGTGSLTKTGSGTWTLSGSNTYTGATILHNGTLLVGNGGNISATNYASVGQLSGETATLTLQGTGQITTTGGDFNVTDQSGSTGLLNVSGGTLSALTLYVAKGNNVATNTYGYVNQTGGVVQRTGAGGDWRIGGNGGTNDVNAVGIYNISGGTLSSGGSNFQVGYYGAGELNISGSASVSAGQWPSIGRQLGGYGVLDVSGGSFTQTTNGNSLIIGEVGTGILNLRGGTVTLNSTNANALMIGNTNATTNVGIVNLLSGLLTARSVGTGNAGAISTLNFNGGTLQANTTGVTLVSGLTNAYVYSGGATIDTQTNNVTISQALLSPATSNGINLVGGTLAVASGGSGYYLAPIVQFTGGTLAAGGAAATGVASIDGTGKITSITITNPGNYTAAPTGISLLGSYAAGGSAATAPSISGYSTNVSGGLTKIGSGGLTLSGTNTYTGVTSINAGTLQFAKTYALYNGTTGNWTAANLPVASGATVAFNVGGTSEFTTGNVTTLLTNLGGLGGAVTNNGLQAGSAIGFDTTNSGGTFTIVDNIANSTGTGGGAIGLVKLGTGTLILSGSSSYSGGTSINAGVLSVTNNYNLGGSGGITLAGGTLVNGGSTNFSSPRNITLTAAGYLDTGTSVSNTSSFSGTVTNGANLLTLQGSGTGTYSGTIGVGATPTGGVAKLGTGKWILSGANGYTGGTTVGVAATPNGILDFTGSVSTSAIAVHSGTFQVDTNGAVTVAGGAAANSIQIGVAAADTSAGSPTLSITGGTLALNGLAAPANFLTIADNNGAGGTGAVGTVNQTGGTFNIGLPASKVNYVSVGAAGNGIYNLSGGTINSYTNAGFNIGDRSGSTGTMTISSSGQLNILSTDGLFVGKTSSTGTLNLNAGSTGGVNTPGIVFGNATGTVGTINLNGGTLAVGAGGITQNATTATLHFNGGTLKSTGAFNIATGIVLDVDSGGAIIDTTGGNITPNAASPLIHGTGTPDGGLTKLGANTLTLSGTNTYTGVTTVSGGTLQFAKPAALYNSTTGSWIASNISVGSGATLAVNVGGTNDFTPAQVVTLLNGIDGVVAGNGLNAGSIFGMDTTNAAAAVTYSGVIADTTGTGGGAIGLTKLGTNTLILSGSNTYTGTTSLLGGTLQANNASALGTGGNITLNGGTLQYTAASAVQDWSTRFKNSISTLALDTNAVNVTLGGIVDNTNAAGLTKLGSGTLTLGAANTYTGGTTVNAGTLQLSGAGTLGGTTGPLTVNAAILDLNGTNQTVGALGGTGGTILNNFGSGTSTLTAGGGALSSLIVDNSTGAGKVALVVSGGVTLTGSNTYSGGTTVSSGYLQLNTNATAAAGTGPIILSTGGTGGTASSFLLGAAVTAPNAISGAGYVENYNGAATTTVLGGNLSYTGNTYYRTAGSTFNFATTGNNTLAGIIGSTLGGYLGSESANGNVIKSGTGTLTLAGSNVYTGTTTVSNGVLNVTGGINSANTAGIGTITVADGTTNALLTLNGGTVNATSGNPSLSIGGAAGTGTGVVVVNSGSTLTTTGEVWMGTNGNGTTPNFGALLINGGTVTSGSYLALGRGNIAGTNLSRGELVMAGGTLTVSTNSLEIGSFQEGTSATSLMTLSGGKVTVSSGNVNVGQVETGILDISGGTLATSVSTGVGIRFNNSNNGQTSIVNLRGGLINTGIVFNGGGTASIFNFNGGTLQANIANTNFMAVTKAYVYGGGAVIDTQANNITIAQPLLTPATGSGVALGAFGTLGVSGSGYVAPPIIDVSGGGGTGATAAASIDASGNLTNITITNPGVGYSSSPTFTLVGGGGTYSGTVTATTTANTSGGLTKLGSGILTLGGSNTYTGGTSVNAGTLSLTGTLAAASPLYVASGATLTTGVNNAFGNPPTGAWTILGTITGTANAQTMPSSVTLTGGTMSGTAFATYGTFLNSYNTTITATGTSLISAGNIGMGAGNALTLNTPGLTDSLTVSGYFGGTSASAGSLIKTGAGQVTLSGSNIYTGGTTLNAGTLVLNNATALGTGAGTLTINGGTLDTTVANELITANNPQIWNSDFGFAGTQNLSLGTGAVSLGTTAGTTRTLTVNAATLTVGGVISNGTTAGGLTKAGAGTLTLTANNAFTGAILVSAGTLKAAVTNINSGNPTSGPLGNATVARTITINHGATLELNVGNIFGTGTYAQANVALADSGIIINTSNDTNTLGALTLTGGTLTASAGTANASFQSYVFSQGVTVNGTTQSVMSTAGTTNAGFHLGANAAANITFNVDPSATGAALLVSAPLIGGSGTAGGVAGSGIIKTGVGTMILSGTNTYSGGTTVSAGALNIQSNSGLGASSGVLVAAGAALQLQGTISTTTASPLTLSGTGVTASPNGALENVSGTNTYSGLITLGAATTIGVDAGTLNLTNTGTIYGTATGLGLTLTGAGNGSIASIINGGVSTAAGAGTLTKAGAGTWTLSGNNTYTGTTTVTGGVLNLAGGSLSGGILLVAPTAGQSAVLNQIAGTNNINGGDSRIGGNTATDTTAYGVYNLAGGAATTASNVQIGAYGTGEMNVSGGTFTATAAYPVVGRFTGGFGVLDVSAGSFSDTSTATFLIIGEQGTGVLNVRGSGSVSVNNTRTGDGLGCAQISWG